MYTVYLIVFPDNKKYVGITTNLKKRLQDHYSPLYNKEYKVTKAINYFKPANLRVEILAEKLHKHEAYILEEHISNCFNTIKDGYNSFVGRPIGKNNPMYGRSPSEATRKLLSESQKLDKHYNAILVENIKTGEFFGCIKSASIKYNIPYLKLYHQIKKNKHPFLRIKDLK